MNSINLIGRLGGDPNLSDVNGDSVVNFSVAVNNGGDNPDWIQVEFWGDVADTIAEYFSKGDQIGVTGALKQSIGEDGTNYYKVRGYTFDFVGDNDENEDFDDPSEDGDVPF